MAPLPPMVRPHKKTVQISALKAVTIFALGGLLLVGCSSLRLPWWPDPGPEPGPVEESGAVAAEGPTDDPARNPAPGGAGGGLGGRTGSDAPAAASDRGAAPGAGSADLLLDSDLRAPVGAPNEWAVDEERRAWVRETLESLTLRQKVGQMLMPRVPGDFSPEGSAGYELAVQRIDEQQVGGFIVSAGTPMDVAAKLNVLQRSPRIPLLVAADLERGAGFRMRGATFLPGGTDLGGATEFPSLMALGAAGDRFLAYETGRVTAEEARAVGIHVSFAPVLDVNNNPDNPIINTRSFGEDPLLVSALGSCLVRGIQDYGAVATGKHFPGHGNTNTDSHLSLPVIPLTIDQLEETELVPFREVVAVGMGAVMTAHVSIPELTGDLGVPATLSSAVLTGLLRSDIGFDGLVFTDAMDMEAIGRSFTREEAAARAVEAGADVLLMPPDLDAAIRGVMTAVLSGRIPEERIDESVGRILALKAELGLHRERAVDLEGVLRRVGIPEHLEIAQEVADRSLTLLRNERGLLPLAGTRTADVISVTYRRTTDLLAGRAFNARLRETYPRLRTATVEPDTGTDEYERLLERARGMDLVVVSLHITAVSSAGTVAAPPELVEFLQTLSASGRPHVVISFGNPYLLSDFPDVQAYLLAWSGAEVSQRAAARALFGDLPIVGRTPTRIPPEYGIGDGIQLPARNGATLPARGACG